jgi:hypothetical protein
LFGNGGIIDDDFVGTPPRELVHGSLVLADASSGTPDLYRLAQARLASYEVVLDGVSGDLFPGISLDRLAGDGVTVVQSAVPAGAGTALSLRFENGVSLPIFDQRLRVTGATCGGGCGPSDAYRLRAYETTGRIPRFNNSATQITTVVLENPTSSAVFGHLHFWSGAGLPLHAEAFGINAHSTLVFASSAVPALQGRSGSITVTHDAPYGAITGKAVALEPATGFSFDSLLQSRPR